LRSQLAGPADAADALRDTSVVASAKVAGLRDRGRLRAWLFAVARNECHGRLPAGVAAARDQAAGLAAAAAGPGVGDGRAGLPAGVHAALAALSPADGELIELGLRHGLGGADLADVLGVPAARVHALAGRSRSRFGAWLAIAAGRAGPGTCPELAALAAGRGGALTAPRRGRAGRHLQRCPVCARRLGRLSPARLVSLVPAPVVPAGLPRRIFRLTADASPGAVAYRARIARGAEPFGAGGFPVQLITPAAPRWRGSPPGGGRRDRRRRPGGARRWRYAVTDTMHSRRAPPHQAHRRRSPRAPAVPHEQSGPRRARPGRRQRKHAPRPSQPPGTAPDRSRPGDPGSDSPGRDGTALAGAGPCTRCPGDPAAHRDPAADDRAADANIGTGFQLGKDLGRDFVAASRTLAS